MILADYQLGKNTVFYVKNRDRSIGLCICPTDRVQRMDFEDFNTESMIQVKFGSDSSFIEFAEGLTMLSSVSVHDIYIVKQEVNDDEITTVLCDQRSNEYIHHLIFHTESNVFETYITYNNRSQEERELEHFSAFSLSGIKNLNERKKTVDGCKLHRLLSFWSAEGRKVTNNFEDLGLEDSWGNQGARTERFGQVGSMPVRKYFPFASVEEPSGVCWTVNFEAPYSWQMEALVINGCATLAGGFADYEFGHWKKKILAGESFTTRRAFFSVDYGFDCTCANLVDFYNRRLSVPESEEHLPVICNEYCTTYGNPDENRIKQLAQKAKTLGAEYFIIDAGWYKKPGINWCYSIGDWKESEEFFPNGLKNLVTYIKDLGLKAGIWFEYENCAIDSEIYHKTDWLLKRNGIPINDKYRRFFDLRQKEVKDYIGEKVFRFLADAGFEYVKVDYNGNYGRGCDGAESEGEAGRQVAEESLALYEKLARAVPDLIIENCASGGHRLEPARMQLASMASFSDAHECIEVPVIAANVSRIIPRRQNQIWATLKNTYSENRFYHLLLGNFYGRLCLSGDFDILTPRQVEICCECISFYKELTPLLKDGRLVRLESAVAGYRNPKGIQIGIIEYRKQKLLLLHTFGDVESGEIEFSGVIVKSVGSIAFHIEKRDEKQLIVYEKQDFGALAILLDEGEKK